MKSRFSKFIQAVVLTIAIFTSSLSNAQSIFSNAITGNNPSNQDPYSTNQVIVSGITSTGIGQGGGLNNSNSTNTYEASSWSTNGTLNTGNNEYFDWTITPTGCNEIDFSSLILFYQRSANGPQSIALRSSVNNYATNIWTSALTGTTEQNVTIDLSAVAFQNVNTAITFRMYGWNSSNTNGDFSINSFDFQGAVVSTGVSQAGVVSGNETICFGTTSALSVSGGVGNIQWQSSTNNVAFTNITGATNSTYNTTVISLDTYYRAVFTNGTCASANSTSILVDVLSNNLTAVGDSSCVAAALTIGVTETCPSVLNTINWYASSIGGSSLGTGNTFTTPVLNSTTTYYAGTDFTAGATLATGNRSATLQRGLIFDAFVPFVLNTVQINTNGAGSITLELRDDLNQPVAGAAAVVFNAAAGTNTVPLGWSIPAGTGYRIIKTAGTIQFSRTDPFTFPIGANGVLAITSSVDNGAIEDTRYFYFYNWNVSTIRIPVVAAIGFGNANTNTNVTACDSYTWSSNGETYFASGIYTFATGCSNDTLELTITPSTISTTVESACDVFTWSVNGQQYTASGTYTVPGDCITEVLELTIIPSTSNTTVASACDVYVWDIDGQQYTASGTYTFVNGCVTEILELTITPSSTNITTESACDVFTWSVNGQQYTSSGTYIFEVGCVTEMLQLTITPSTSNTTVVSACDFYTWSVNGTTYVTSGTYISVTECNTEILELTISPSATSTIVASACDSYTWSSNGTTYTTSGTYTSVTGCLTETLVLTITPSTNNTTTISACDSYTWSVNGVTYAMSGTYTSVNGCNTETLVLTITPSTNNTTTVNACDSYTWTVNGTTYTTSGTYTSVTGCNTETLVLTITPSTNNTTTISSCGSYTWSVNAATYNASGTYTFVSGCSTETLVLTIETTSLYFVDTDLDGFGSTVSELACASSAGYSLNSNDCNDANGSVNPNATEICNSMDDNCNAQIDEGVQTVYFIDNDGDNFGNASVAIMGCIQPAGYTADNNDCNDTNAGINPGAEEILGNGIDENCDGQIDNSITELSASISLYPNPARSDLNVQVNSSTIGDDLYIYDAVGKVVYKQQVLSTQTTISVSNFENGNYILRVGEVVKRFEVIK